MEIELNADRMSTFRIRVSQAFQYSRKQTISVKHLTEEINKNMTNNELFSQFEIDAALVQMADANQVMVSDGIAYLI